MLSVICQRVWGTISHAHVNRWLCIAAVSHEDRLRGVRETDPLPRYPEHITDSDERQARLRALT